MASPREWWFWRLSPAPKKRLQSIMLPWSYLQRDRDDEALDEAPEYATTSELRTSTNRWFGLLRHGMGLIEAHLKRLGLSTDGHLEESPIGAMRALKITSRVVRGASRRTTKRVFWLTPPVEQFCDLTKHFDRATIREELGYDFNMDDGTYWINRDVFEASGEFLKGSLSGVHRVKGGQSGYGGVYAPHEVTPGVIKAADLPHAESPIADYIMVALDSYLERGPDPRFNPRSR